MMTQQQFDAQLQHIEDQAAAKQERVEGYRDRAMAKLFIMSEWSQDKLAEHLGKRWGKELGQQWVSQHLRFGRFISFFTTCCSENESYRLPPNLTEGGFRTLWERTEATGNFSGKRAHTEAADADEKRRFAEVVELLKAAGLSRPKRQVRKALIAIAGKAGWLSENDICERLATHFGGQVFRKDVSNVLAHWNTTSREPYRVERTLVDAGLTKYRLVKIAGTVVDKKQIAKWSYDLIPMLNDLIRECQKHRVERSDTHLAAQAIKIKKVLESITAVVPSEV